MGGLSSLHLFYACKSIGWWQTPTRKGNRFYGTDMMRIKANLSFSVKGNCPFILFFFLWQQLWVNKMIWLGALVATSGSLYESVYLVCLYTFEKQKCHDLCFIVCVVDVILLLFYALSQQMLIYFSFLNINVKDRLWYILEILCYVGVYIYLHDHSTDCTTNLCQTPSNCWLITNFLFSFPKTRSSSLQRNLKLLYSKQEILV